MAIRLHTIARAALGHRKSARLSREHLGERNHRVVEGALHLVGAEVTRNLISGRATHGSLTPIRPMEVELWSGLRTGEDGLPLLGFYTNSRVAFDRDYLDTETSVHELLHGAWDVVIRWWFGPLGEFQGPIADHPDLEMFLEARDHFLRHCREQLGWLGLNAHRRRSYYRWGVKDLAGERPISLDKRRFLDRMEARIRGGFVSSVPFLEPRGFLDELFTESWTAYCIPQSYEGGLDRGLLEFVDPLLFRTVGEFDGLLRAGAPRSMLLRAFRILRG